MNVNRAIYFYAPSLKKYVTEYFSNSGIPSILPISITGRWCALMCKHCKGRLLESMYEARDGKHLFSLASSFKEKGIDAILLSGGSTKEGRVPLSPFFSSIKRIKEELGMKIFVHTGIVDEDFAKNLREANIDIVLIDIIGSDKTVKEVYNLSLNKEAFFDSLKYLCAQGLKVVPHVVVGIHWGRLDGEYNALNAIRKFPVKGVVLVGLFPQIGTPMQDVKGPEKEEWRKLFLFARSLFHDTPLLLGCQRSPYNKKEVEEEALKIGIDAIAYPCEETVELAQKMGYTLHFSKHCCASLIDEVD